MRRSSILIALVATGIFSTAGYLAAAGNNSMDHSSHGGQVTTSNVELALPTEPGQSAFAAIAEIVELLNSNPKTNWSKVNIARLREHLVDMQLLMTEAIANQSREGDTITYVVRGDGRALIAIRNMVPAHAEELNKSTPWGVENRAIEGGVQMKVSSHSEAIMTKLEALGFFGVMAIGAHHQAHHLAMAKGEIYGH